MKRNLLTLVAIAAIGAGGFAWAQQGAIAPGGPPGGSGAWHAHGGGGPLDHLSDALNLTPDQKAKVQPIIDQAKPQLMAIHQEAMAKAKGIMDSTMAQIRPLLTPEQQAKADELQKAHQDMHNAVKELHDANSK
jgi:Spy/CpxP family protein refolding chaperone